MLDIMVFFACCGQYTGPFSLLFVLSPFLYASCHP